LVLLSTKIRKKVIKITINAKKVLILTKKGL